MCRSIDDCNTISCTRILLQTEAQPRLSFCTCVTLTPHHNCLWLLLYRTPQSNIAYRMQAHRRDLDFNLPRNVVLEIILWSVEYFLQNSKRNVQNNNWQFLKDIKLNCPNCIEYYIPISAFRITIINTYEINY